MPQTICIELNEINFKAIEHYITQGKLPQFRALIAKHGYWETASEQEYEHLEPWIQWVTAHTGKSFAEHKVFRLGDSVGAGLDQIWEQLEARGLRVGAVSPMNAENRTRDAAFFVPDPWTPTNVSGGFLLNEMYKAVAQAVNDNAQSRITPRSIVSLLAGAARYARPINYSNYLALAGSARKSPWRKPLFLDLLFADVFVTECRRTRVDFATLFLNAGAHIQHHYMFSSKAYSGPSTNPDWYVPPGVDPVLEVYETYDRILHQVTSSLPGARFLVSTGLHQEPYPVVAYYWRLKDHAAFLKQHDLPFASVEPRMSRDFFIRCDSTEDANTTAARLSAMSAEDGTPLFDVDNRGKDLFVMLVYPHAIEAGFKYRAGNSLHEGLAGQVAFVAIKNGEHDGIGYLIDTSMKAPDGQQRRIALTEVYQRMLAAAGPQTGGEKLSA